VSTGLGALLHHLDTGAPLDGPMSVEIGRIGQLLVDSAALSARVGRRVEVDANGPRLS
jgi:glucose-fructose oxidoreductase